MKIQRYQNAALDYEKVLERCPDDTDALMKKGRALIELTRFEEAISAFKQVIQYHPDHADAWISKGSALFESGNFQEALKAFEEGCRLHPDEPGIWEQQGTRFLNWADLKRRFQRSKRQYRCDRGKDICGERKVMYSKLLEERMR